MNVETPGGDTSPEGVQHGSVVRVQKTPLYEAYHAARYQRQELIRSIESITGQKLISYVTGERTMIDRDDAVGFVDLLHPIKPGSGIDLVLHTGGGDIDAAEKLISMVRDRVGDAQLRVVVPDFAKSAGTLMALGADVILMSDSSELGPIDPQVIFTDSSGNRFPHSTFSYLDAYKRFSKALREDPSDLAAKIMISKMEPHTLMLFEAACDRAQQLAEKLLSRGMLKGKNYTQAATQLLDTSKWRSHGQMISWEDARDTKLDLNVKYYPLSDDLWQTYWRLHCLQRLAIQDHQKLFESDIVSLTIDN